MSDDRNFDDAWIKEFGADAPQGGEDVQMQKAEAVQALCTEQVSEDDLSDLPKGNRTSAVAQPEKAMTAWFAEQLRAELQNVVGDKNAYLFDRCAGLLARLAAQEQTIAELRQRIEALIPCQSPDPELCDNQHGHPIRCHCLDPVYWKASVERLEKLAGAVLYEFRRHSTHHAACTCAHCELSRALDPEAKPNEYCELRRVFDPEIKP